jgi:hypothetical protein
MISRSLAIFFSAFLAFFQPILAATNADTPKAYVYHFDGKLNLSEDEFREQTGKLFSDLDSKRVSSFLNMRRSQAGKDTFALTVSFEAKSSNDVAYVEQYAVSHPEVVLGETTIQMRKAMNFRELISLEVYGPGKGRQETLWDTFVNFHEYPNHTQYFNSAFATGTELDSNDPKKFKESAKNMLTPFDAMQIAQYIDGVSAPGGGRYENVKMTRFKWKSLGFFVMEDGSTISSVGRLELDRILDATRGAAN